MSPTVVWGYKAIKPITAWHNEREVTYQPGEEVPAGEWKGAAVDALVENGKIMRYATNVYAPGDFAEDAPLIEAEAVGERMDGGELPADVVAEDVGAGGAGSYPIALGGGSYELSDGQKVKGKAKALAAQAQLDVAAEGA